MVSTEFSSTEFAGTEFPQRHLFILSDTALREVIDQLKPADLERDAPATWTRAANPTVRDILAAHAKDEAWVPDVIAGKTIEEVGDSYDGDLLGHDPIANYDRLNDEATIAVGTATDPDKVAHLSYGDFPLSVYFEHTSYYRGFQAWSIAKLVGIPFAMSDELVDALLASVEPQLQFLREIHVFGPEVEVPDDADSQTRLLGITGFWIP